MTDLAASDVRSSHPEIGVAMEGGTLVPEDFEIALRRAADVLSDLLRKATAPGADVDLLGESGRIAVQVYGNAVVRKLTRLLQGIAELRGQAMEISSVVHLVDQVATGRARPTDVYAELRSIFDRIHQPYTLIGSDGVRRGAAEGDPRIADLPNRSFAIDDVREVVWRSGREIQLRRRNLLRRFLLLFASSPGVVFSKEDVVRAVWGVEYHPLRNDPALFTSVMRVRRMLDDAEGDLLRCVEGGYRLVVPDDFCCVIRTGVTSSTP
jgi:hypothetical protein